MALQDIPVRDSQDPSTQLKLLRAYLKDSDSSAYTWSDDYLIQLLESYDKVTAWRGVTGAGPEAIPWSYDAKAPFEPINRLRLVIGDTTEDSLTYTDDDLLKLLQVMPLRYVASLIKAKVADGKTFPKDPQDPIHIVRKYLDDEAGVTYTDVQIVELLFAANKNPYDLVVELLDSQIGSAASSSTASTGSGLASLDGITFSKPEDTRDQDIQNRDLIVEQGLKSVYARDPVYGVYESGVNTVKTDWEVRWYGL